LAVTLILSHYCSFAQLLPDSVHGTKSFINEIIKNYKDENTFAFDLNAINLSVKIPVRVHIVRNVKGTSGVSSADINSSISTANSYFKNIGIQFFVDSVNYINDYNYSYITYNYNKTELLTKYALLNRINLFMVDSIDLLTIRSSSSGRTSYGYTYFPNAPDSNFIFLDKQFVPGKYLTTMLGHFMGLLSTHETKGGSEMANENNCAKSGDFICDTYADPDLFNQVDSACNYKGSAKDTTSKFYIPTVANMMSNSPDNCKCIFTELQYKRMFYYYLRYRQYLKF